MSEITFYRFRISKFHFLKYSKKIDFFVEDWNSGQRSEESRGMVVVQNARLIYPLKMRGLTLKVNFNTQGQISWSTFGSELDLEGQSTHFHRVNGARILYYSWWMLFFQHWFICMTHQQTTRSTIIETKIAIDLIWVWNDTRWWGMKLRDKNSTKIIQAINSNT